MSRSADETRFDELSESLADAIDERLSDWTVRSVEERARAAGIIVGEDVSVAAREAGERCRVEVGAEIRELLSTDIDEQRSTPLVILRSATSYATGVLVEIGVPEVRRDEYERRAFPLDIYDLAPASLAAVHESLVEPGIMWGAAKAHIHRQRHR